MIDEVSLQSRRAEVGVTAVHGSAIDLEALYDEQWHTMVRLAVLLVDDRAEAEDVVQDAFVALQRRAAHLRNSGAAVGYLRTSVVNGARSRLRRRLVARRHLFERSVRLTELELTCHGADHEVITAAEHAAVIAALRELPDRQREVLILRYWSGLSEAEIAETLGISKGTVKSTASRGLDALEQKLGGLS